MDAVQRRRASAIERGFEQVIFGSRWLLAPFYLGLAGSLVVLLVKFVKQAFALIVSVALAGGNDIMIGILSLIDLSLMGNLLLMVIFGGYESFVSRMDI